jgi:hypothetical protein
MPEPAVSASKVSPARQDIEKERPPEHQAEARKHSEQRKNDRERHRRYTERKARQDEARWEQEEHQQQEVRHLRESPSILAFDGDGEPPRQNAFFGD